MGLSLTFTQKLIVKQDKTGKILRDLRTLDNSFVTVGVHESAGSYPEGPTVAEVATYNHFGTDTIPARPWLSRAVDKERGGIENVRDEALNDMIRGLKTPRKALDTLGFDIQRRSQNMIQRSRSWAEPNAEGTIEDKRRGGAIRGPTPLIRSGLMLRSVAWETKIR